MSTHTLLIVVIALLILSTAASAKTGSTFYTPERVANARKNIERYEWAKKTRDDAVKAANEYAELPDDFLWNLVTPQDIPRGIHVNKAKGCPKCGLEINKFGNYPWKCDVIRQPWKIECPSCGEVFPKNDFAKFYESGKDENGVFHFDKADRSLLYNSDHPDPKDPLHTYGVDDSLGWKDDKGNVYRFIGYYGHYGSWTAVLSALRRLADAYVYTGDTLYARKAGVMLYRAAQFYPEMDWSKWSKLGFENSDGNSGFGKIYGRIWETGTAKTLISVYDAVYPGIADPELLKYLSQKTGQQVDVVGVRSLVEENIIRETHDGILKRQIAGNEGMHQSTMAMAAVVLDEPGTSEKWLEWIFADGNVVHGDPAGGNMKRLFETKIDDDGMGNEASPDYNGLWRRLFRSISDIIQLYPRYKGTTITDFPKYRKMFEVPVRLICLNKFIPIIGDTGKTGAPGLGGIAPEELIYACNTFKDPLFARMAYYVNGGKVEGLREDIFDPDPEAIAGEIEKIVKESGLYVPETDSMPHYGLAILRSGKDEDQRALSLYYGRNTGHGHKDTLNIELFGYGLDLMPDLGYPEYATVWAPRAEWTSNTISHNTVVVDRKKQKPTYSGKARFVAKGDGASAVEVFASEVYPQTSLYQRTAVMVDVSDKEFYVVDIFRVKGGEEHHYSLHGPEGQVSTEGLQLVAQKSGTLAGEDIPYGADLGGRDKGWEDASGFQYLYDVQRDKNPSKNPVIEWNVKDTWGVRKQPDSVHLKMYLVSPPGEVVLAHGDPPQNKPGNPRTLTYVILPHKSAESTFVSVMEPYTGKSFIKSIERKDKDGTVELTVTLASGRVDHIVSVSNKRVGVLSEEGDKLTQRLAVVR